MKNLLHLLLLSASLSFAAAAPSAPPPQDLRYTFNFQDPTHIRVTLDLTPRHPGSELLILPSQWAGQTQLFRAVSGLHATGPDATLTPTSDPAHWLLRTSHPGPVTIAYTLSQDWSGPLKHPLEHRAILGPTLFEFTGENGLVTPAIPGPETVHVNFDFTNLPPSQALVTSFGTAPHQTFQGIWSDVRNALFTGGDMSTRTLDVDGQPVTLAMHGKWTFQPEDIAPRITAILSAERRLWRDTTLRPYAIVISPYEDPNSGGGGSGFTDIANLFLSDRETFTDDTASLLAHEAFHHWNPSGLGFVEDTEHIAWFGEGFTSFFQDTVLVRAGLLDSAGYLARLNLTIKDYLLSPRINTSNADLERLPPTDHFAYQEPYLRGAMIALWLASEIERQTAGRHTLTDLMLALRDDRRQPLSADRIFLTAARFVDPPSIARLRSFAIDGVSVPIPASSLGECVAFNKRPAWTFNLGFDTASLQRAGIVRGVEQGSNAWQAGVRDGQQLGGFSLWNGNAEREVTLTLREIDGKREKLTFLPRGKLLSIPQAEIIPGCPAGPRIPQ